MVQYSKSIAWLWQIGTRINPASHAYKVARRHICQIGITRDRRCDIGECLRVFESEFLFESNKKTRFPKVEGTRRECPSFPAIFTSSSFSHPLVLSSPSCLRVFMFSLLSLIRNLVDLSFWHHKMADPIKVSNSSNLLDTMEVNTCRGYVLITRTLTDRNPALRPPWTG